MSYYRAFTADEVAAWLLSRGFAEENPGYGHVSAQDLAEALVEKFDVLGYSSKPAG